MNNFEKEINCSTFYKYNKSFLINLEHMKRIKQYTAILVNKEEVSRSRYRFKYVKDRFFNLIKDKLC